MSDALNATWSRRNVLRAFGATVATAVAGCAPARIVLGAYPSQFKYDGDLDDRILRAFVVTIVPGVAIDQPDLARVFGDPFYPFAKYRAFFASDLCRRADKVRHNTSFELLTLVERTRVVVEGLHADSVTQRLYRGAVMLAQAATYGGIYTRSGDVPLIDFKGFRYEDCDPEACTYPDAQRFFAAALTLNGNPA
jgi:hypothetical protein